MKKRICACAVLLLATTSLASSRMQDFRYPRGDAGATRYSPLTQINARNVGRLKQVWRYDLKPDSELQNTPIVIDGVLYGVGSGKVVALIVSTLGIGKVPNCRTWLESARPPLR